jgi:thiamine biosynthesis lipoprotein
MVKLARNAMATRFEIVLHGSNEVALRAAGEEALGEIDRLEEQLSLYRPTSEIAHVNARAAQEPVRITPSLFALLERAQKLHAETGGAFDITIAPLVRCWGFMGGTGHLPSPAELAEARGKVGMHLVQLDAERFTVQFACEGVMLDLGAIGKGYAIERAVEILHDAGVSSALIHGGTSTVYGLGQPPEDERWKVAVENPENRMGAQPGDEIRPLTPTLFPADGEREKIGPSPSDREREKNHQPLAVVCLRNEALSVSAIWGRCFQADGKTFGHVLDPRTGQPVERAVLAAVVLPSATETDALSTALLTRGAEDHEAIAKLRQGMRTLLVRHSEMGFCVENNLSKTNENRR